MSLTVDSIPVDSETSSAGSGSSVDRSQHNDQPFGPEGVALTHTPPNRASENFREWFSNPKMHNMPLVQIEMAGRKMPVSGNRLQNLPRDDIGI